MVRLTVGALANSVFIIMLANMVAGAHLHTRADCLPIANNLQSILNHYQEVSQNPAHTATPKNYRLYFYSFRYFENFVSYPLNVTRVSVDLSTE